VELLTHMPLSGSESLSCDSCNGLILSPTAYIEIVLDLVVARYCSSCVEDNGHGNREVD